MSSREWPDIAQTPLWKLGGLSAPRVPFCDWDDELLERLRSAAQLESTEYFKRLVVHLATSLGIEL